MKYIFIVSIALIFKNARSQDAIGNWFNIDNNCVYNELYISDNLLTNCNSDTGGNAFVYNYKKSQDTIYLFFENKQIDKIIFKLYNDDVLELFFNNEWQTYFKISENIKNFFLIPSDDLIKFDEFYFDFNQRAQKMIHLIKKINCQ